MTYGPWPLHQLPVPVRGAARRQPPPHTCPMSVVPHQQKTRTYVAMPTPAASQPYEQQACSHVHLSNLPAHHTQQQEPSSSQEVQPTSCRTSTAADGGSHFCCRFSLNTTRLSCHCHQPNTADTTPAAAVIGMCLPLPLQEACHPQDHRLLL